jgi:hypothetical protein
LTWPCLLGGALAIFFAFVRSSCVHRSIHRFVFMRKKPGVFMRLYSLIRLWRV